MWDPAARFQSAAEMGRALGALLSDPVTAREAVERFQADMAQLDGSAAAAPIRAPAGGAPVGVVDPLALPVAAGESPRDLHGSPLSIGSRVPSLDAPPRSLLVSNRGSGNGSIRSTTTAFFVCIALAIIGFTGWRIVAPPAPEIIPPVAEAPPAATEASGANPESTPEKLPSEASVQAVDPPVEEVAKALPVPEPRTSSKPSPAPAPKKKKPTPPPPAKKAPPRRSSGPGAYAGTGAASSAPVPVGRGKLTVSSIPKARVIVDGKFIRQSPLYRFEVAAGTRVVTLMDSEGNRKTFQVDVPVDGEVRRVWSFVDNRFESE